ncbi:hypothetical protein [Falsiroseomonas sp. HW251]|uniref:hypothetical protein n=1 Tax=Falsiroseomonas sp. HW251 TaxID=3390998 RepID=UPI003D31047E
MAPAADAPQRPGRALRRDPALTGAPPPFQVDPHRLYDVSAGGGLRRAQEDPAALARRRSRQRWLLAAGIATNLLTWSLAALALVLGGRGWGAAAGILALLTLPMLGLPLLAEARAHLIARRRLRGRPDGFPGPGGSGVPRP